MSVRSVHWYLYMLVPSTMKIATSRGLLWWLAGWPPFRAALRPRSKRTQRVHVLVACALHCGKCGYMEQISASSVLVGARTHIELTWPNGPMVAVGHVHHNNKSIHCLNHCGGDSHPEGAARFGSHAFLNERHLC